MEPDLHYLLDTEPHDSDWQKVAESLATHPPPFSGNTKDYEIWYHGFKSTFSGLDGMKKYFHESLDDVLHHGLVVDDLGEWQKYNLEKEKWVLWRGLFEATKHQDCQATVVSAGKESDGYLSLLALRSRYEASIEQRRVEADASLNSWSYDERQGFPDNLGHLERLAETANQAHGHKKYDREDTAQRMLQDLKRHIDNPFCRELVRVFISGGKFNYARMKQSSSLVIAHLGDARPPEEAKARDEDDVAARANRLNECTVSGRPGVLKLADGTLVPIKAEGVVQVTLCTASGSLKTIQLLHSLLVPQLTVNLLSIGQLTDSKCAVEFEEAGEVSCIKEKATGLLYPFLKYGAVYWIGLTHDRSMQLYSLFKNQFLVDACKD
ncbi:unnamed protein product [Vitrella brassicaformis CCMP3155]|uniref:Uncharacterized protein n=2 Tax=Vitrella brassicaformis TaxID=1169539 RepID=A0A0G4H5M4_VITBC|nr:unnamed protein product [Vitrella brassicaformis CCMP3155]|eukprot:CEM38930.1 unnamed protein product [Vitrella brassicaformis CCMP3155]